MSFGMHLNIFDKQNDFSYDKGIVEKLLEKLKTQIGNLADFLNLDTSFSLYPIIRKVHANRIHQSSIIRR